MTHFVCIVRVCYWDGGGGGSIFIYRRYLANRCSFWWSMFWPHPGGSATPMALQPLCPGPIAFQWVYFSCMLVTCSVTGHSISTNYYGTTFCGMPGSFNSSQINACVMGIGVLGPRYSLFQRTRAAQNVAPEIQTLHSPHARQAPYH